MNTKSLGVFVGSVTAAALFGFLALHVLDMHFLPDPSAWTDGKNIWAVAIVYWGVCMPLAIYAVRRTLNPRRR